MGGWKEISLGEIINLKRGFDLPNKEREHGQYPIFSSSGISGYHSTGKVKGPGVVTGRYGTIGQVFYSIGDFWPLNTSLYVQDFKGNDPKFIYYFLIGFGFDKYSDKSAVPGINRNDVHTETVFLPTDINEQRAIASVLSSLDDKIDLLHHQNKTLEALAETLFRHWFVEEAEQWSEQGTVKDLIEIQSGFAFKSADFREAGQYRLVTIKNVQDGYLDLSKTDFLDQVPDKLPDYCRLQVGDILLSLTGNVGRCCFVTDQNLLLNQRVAKLSPRNKRDWALAYLMFRRSTMRRTLEELAKGTAQANLSPIETQEVEMTIPGEGAFERFSNTATPMLTKVLDNYSQIHTLTQLRDTLLPKLMSGEVRVKGFDEKRVDQTEEVSFEPIYTIGHSNHPIEQFITLLKKHRISVLADVRSVPYSRMHPQFNREALERVLRAANIMYVPLSKELGARPDDPEVFENGTVQYARLEERPYFRSGIDRLLKGRKGYKIALMCAEKDPLNCHRTILVGHHLRNLGIPIKHILASGELEDNKKAEERLIELEGLKPTLFDVDQDREKMIEKAYEKRAFEIAFTKRSEEE